MSGFRRQRRYRYVQITLTKLGISKKNTFTFGPKESSEYSKSSIRVARNPPIGSCLRAYKEP